MLITAALLVLAGILLTHLFESTVKAAVLVGCALVILWIGRGVTFEALTDDAARALYDSTPDRVQRVERRVAPRYFGPRERI